MNDFARRYETIRATGNGAGYGAEHVIVRPIRIGSRANRSLAQFSIGLDRAFPPARIAL